VPAQFCMLNMNIAVGMHQQMPGDPKRLGGKQLTKTHRSRSLDRPAGAASFPSHEWLPGFSPLAPLFREAATGGRVRQESARSNFVRCVTETTPHENHGYSATGLRGIAAPPPALVSIVRFRPRSASGCCSQRA
jgi:hypothetical protein